jgi:hypothetical protein
MLMLQADLHDITEAPLHMLLLYSVKLVICSSGWLEWQVTSGLSEVQMVT